MLGSSGLLKFEQKEVKEELQEKKKERWWCCPMWWWRCFCLAAQLQPPHVLRAFIWVPASKEIQASYPSPPELQPSIIQTFAEGTRVEVRIPESSRVMSMAWHPSRLSPINYEPNQGSQRWWIPACDWLDLFSITGARAGLQASGAFVR